MDNQGMGSHSEPFFELLQPNTPAISHSTGSSSSNFVPNGPRRADSSSFSFNDDVLPSYDFQPLRSNGSGGPRIEETGGKFSYEQQVRDPPITYEKYESTRPRHDFDKDAYDSATVAAVERTMKKYADNLLRVLEGMGGRLSQLEATTQRLEHSFDKVKATVANNHGETDGRLRMLENMVREVQRGVQVLRDKQEINEAQLLLKLQQEKTEVPATKTELQAPPPPPPPPPPPQSVAVPSAPHQPVAVPSAPHQPVIPQQVQPQVPSSQQPSHIPQASESNIHHQAPAPAPPVQHVPQHIPPQPPQVPHIQQQGPPPPPPQFSYHPSSSQAPPPLQQQQQTQSYAHQPEAPPYPPPPPHPHQAPHPQQQSPPVNYNLEMPPPYLPSNYGPPQQCSVRPPPPSQQQNQMYERASSGPLALPPPPPSYHSPQHSYESGYPPSYSRISSSGGAGPGGSGGYPHLPTAQPIQQSMSGRAPSRSGVDDVIDKVAAMGFSRDQVRATVQRLTENGQPVDMNVVLDKLMNGASEAAPPAKGWFGR